MTPELERWSLAVRLLEVHGDRIGHLVEARARHFRTIRDQRGLDFWEDITEKLIRLMGPEAGSRPH